MSILMFYFVYFFLTFSMKNLEFFIIFFFIKNVFGTKYFSKKKCCTTLIQPIYINQLYRDFCLFSSKKRFTQIPRFIRESHALSPIITDSYRFHNGANCLVHTLWPTITHLCNYPPHLSQIMCTVSMHSPTVHSSRTTRLISYLCVYKLIRKIFVSLTFLKAQYI